MIVGVVFGKDQHIRYVQSLIEMIIQGRLEGLQVPTADVQLILLQVSHQVAKLHL